MALFSSILEIMAEWRKRSKIIGDVVSFTYATPDSMKQVPEVFLWDLDKTYLDTKFEDLKGLMKTIFEGPFQKKNVPGTDILVRNLKENWNLKNPAHKSFPIFFITASPPQMERKVIHKLRYDGIEPLALYCKDNLKNLRPSRWWRLTHQLGYKLQALLQLRCELADNVKMTMWGDDSESDVLVYCLFSDICSRRLDENQLQVLLRSLHVGGEQTETIFQLQYRVPVFDPVHRIYINLDQDTDSEYYLKFGRRAIPTYSTFQTAIDLFQENHLTENQVAEVAAGILSQGAFSPEQLARHLDDLIRRPVLYGEAFEKLKKVLVERKILDAEFTPSVTPRTAPAILHDPVEGLEPWVPETINYLNDYR